MVNEAFLNENRLSSELVQLGTFKVPQPLMFMFHSEAIWSATKYRGSSALSVTSIVNDIYDVNNYIIIYPAFLKVDEMR